MDLERKRVLRDRARELRSRMTMAERLLWSRLRRRALNVRFNRQSPMGGYIVDFVCHEKGLVVEVDGGQHNGNVYDDVRDAALLRLGYRTLRFWNHDVLGNTANVVEQIQSALTEDPPPSSSPARGGGFHPCGENAGVSL